jgi:hypothetical protein
VNTILDKLVEPASPVIFVDLHGYDGYPALACIARGGRTFACTICHEAESAQLVADRVSQSVYAAAKEKRLVLPGFPDFDPVVKELELGKDCQQNAAATAAYKVTVPLADGTLRILDVHLNTFLSNLSFHEDMHRLVQEHNKEFNPTGARGPIADDDVDDTVHEQAAKKARVDVKLPDSDISSYDGLLKAHPDLPAA